MSERLEKQLREALRPENPSPGFAERVLAKAAALPEHPTAIREAQTQVRASSPEHRGRATSSSWWQGMFAGRAWAAAIAAIVLLVFAAGWYQREHAREQEARALRESAKAQALYALRLTNQKIGPARRALAQLGIRLDDLEPAEPPSGATAH